MCKKCECRINVTDNLKKLIEKRDSLNAKIFSLNIELDTINDEIETLTNQRPNV